ncbi:DUF5060 domain-containing protein [Pontibacter vulgaris]|uniref:DUF5060 domain-containing protein n=1 Tax=Pontibacter vulgaris TaxID=2905679 RepID=UPI001FA6FC10|nr:DUF5060 domain-containing protein [Pontibacter vulgaris]
MQANSTALAASSKPSNSLINQIVSFSLINTDTKHPIQVLNNNSAFSLDTLPTGNLNIQANTAPATTGSVVFTLTGTQNHSQVENHPPYTLFGDSGDSYNSWTPAIGNYTLTATPYSAPNGGGTAGIASSINFKVTNSLESVVTGELKKWHKITITFSGPVTKESASTNPFLDYRLNVTFSNGTRQIQVPGYYAADGNASESGASSGNKWRVHFSPDEEGIWNYTASFRTGNSIAVDSSANAGSPAAFDGATGSFTIGPSDKAGTDFRYKGRLQYVGEHYLRFAQTGEYFLKGGADSPENFLAFSDFDSTYSSGTENTIKTYLPHINDWKSSDPVWRVGKGKGIIGALNYLASKGMNAVYFLTMNVNGDGKDVWPWVSHTERYRFDVSKLDQWEVVFTHMDKLGIMLHVVTQERENDQLLDNGELGKQRKLYYRELIARFGHHLAINWNLGEENTNTDSQRKAFADYIKSLDPYKSFISIHTFPTQRSVVYTSLLGYPTLDGASLQISSITDVHRETLKWVNNSASKGRKWVVNLDEIGPASIGVAPDTIDYMHDAIRKAALWGNLMAGGGGTEWYFGYNYPNSDLTTQDWRSRNHMWELTSYALEFFKKYLPYSQMQNADSLTSSTTDYCLALPGKVYAIYLPDGGSTSLNVNSGSDSSTYEVKWYNPRTGGDLQSGSIQQITGSGNKSIGPPPTDISLDWVCLIRNTEVADAPPLSITPPLNNSTSSSAPSVSVFPNPVANSITVQVNLPETSAIEILITDITGKKLLLATSEPVKMLLKEFNLINLKPGAYLLQVKYGDNYTTKKIIKY